MALHPSAILLVMQLSESLEALATLTLTGTGIDPQRAVELAQGAEPVNDTEAVVASALVSGWAAGTPASSAALPDNPARLVTIGTAA